jgi:hypothetical protein
MPLSFPEREDGMRVKTGFRWVAAPLLVAAPLAAQGNLTPAPIVLWGEFTSATSKAEAKALRAELPKGRAEVIADCEAPLMYRVSKGRVVSVLFAAKDPGSDCHSRLLAKYRAELGEPQVASTTFGSALAFGDGDILDTRSDGAMLVWREGDKKTKLIKSPGEGYNLIITVREDKYLY